jgi:lipopolysaccharide heptosyltransferase I
MNRLLVVRLGSLGDLVHALPAVAAIRRAHPAAAIDWLVDAAHRDFLALVPVITEVITLEGRSAAAWLAARRALRARRYDVAIDFQGLLKSAVLARLSGATRVLGFDRAALRERAAAPFYRERVDVGERGHVIDKNLRLAGAIGASGDVLEFPIGPVESAVAAGTRARFPRGYALINPGAAWPNKRWPAERFGAVADLLQHRFDLPSVVMWGPGEGDLAEAVVAASNGAAVAAVATNLPDLVAMARGARLVVSGDTGPLHIAAAVGVPAVALFGPTNPARNGPWRSDDLALSRYDQCHCHYERRCRLPDPEWCLGSIGFDEVRDAIVRRLS